MRIALATLAVLCLAPARARAEDCPSELSTTILPLPVYATSPNEGNTYGVMPVFVRVCKETKRTEWILAPSVTWNSVIEVTGTVRFYAYPDDDTSLSLVGSASTNVNFDVLGIWQRLPARVGAFTDEATVRVEKSIFARFYGLGPDTPSSAESSYTLLRALATVRRGLNLPASLNLGLVLGVEHDDTYPEGVMDLPRTRDTFPDAPGLGGSSLLWQGLELRLDTRRGREYAESGLLIDLYGSIVEGLSSSPDFFRLGASVRGIVPELDWLSGAARLNWAAVTADGVPFYQQSQLGGSYLLRGFTEGRFTDRQAWTLELEQRIRLFQTHVFGVVTDWRVDPFVAAGQVFHDFDRALDNVQFSGGVGLRAFVHPSLVGRIDLATGGEGLKVYVEIGLPY